MEIGDLFVYDPSQQQAVQDFRTRQEIRDNYQSILDQRQRDIEYASKFMENIGELRDQTSALHQDFINEEINELYNDANQNIVRRNKKGKVIGLNINDPDFRSEVRRRTQRIKMMNDRSAMIQQKMEAYAKAEEDNPYLDYRNFYEDLVAKATSPELLAMDSDIDRAFEDLVDQHDQPQIRARKFIESVEGDASVGFRNIEDEGRQFEVTMGTKTGFHDEDGNVRGDINEVLKNRLRENNDPKLNRYLLKTYRDQLKLDPIGTPQLNDPEDMIAYAATQLVPEATIKSRKDITNRDLDTESKKILNEQRKKKLAGGGKEDRTELLKKWAKMVQQPRGPEGTEEEVREGHKRAIGILDSAKDVNEATVLSRDELVGKLRSQTDKYGDPVTLPGIDAEGKESLVDITEAPADDIISFYNIQDPTDYAFIDYKVGTKENDIINLGDPSSFDRLMDIGAKGAGISTDALKTLVGEGDIDVANTGTIYTFEGEEYSIEELKQAYGEDFNPDEYEGFEIKQ